MEQIEDLYDLLMGHWQGTYRHGNRTLSDELAFMTDSKIESSDAIWAHAFGWDRAGDYDVGGAVRANGSFDLTRRRGYMRGTIDLSNKTMSGSWGLNQRRYDGTFNFVKDEGEADRQRVAERQRQRQDGNNSRQEEASRVQAEADATRKREEEEEEAAAAKKKGEEEAELKRKEEEAAKEKQEQEEILARKRIEEETARKKNEEDEARKKAIEEAAQKKAEDDRAREVAEAAAVLNKDAEETARKLIENSQATLEKTAIGSIQHVQTSPIETVDASSRRKPAEITTQKATGERRIADTVRVFKPRKTRQIPIKLDESVDIDTYIKVMTVLRGDKGVDLL